MMLLNKKAAQNVVSPKIALLARSSDFNVFRQRKMIEKLTEISLPCEMPMIVLATNVPEVPDGFKYAQNKDACTRGAFFVQHLLVRNHQKTH